MLSKIENKMFIQLSSCFDDTNICAFTASQYLEAIERPYGNCYYEVSSIKEAIILCEEFRKYFNLDGSNWSGGRIVDNEMKFIAKVSYNGTVCKSE